MIGGKVRSSKRMSPKRKSSKRKSSTKKKSPKTSAWIRKLNAWRKANRHVDGSLPSMKSAMKHCKGRSARKQKCRKNQGRKASPKRKSSKRKSTKRKSSKRKSPKRKSSKRKSTKRKSSKRKMTKVTGNQLPMFGPQTAQAYELRTGKSALTGLQLPIYGPQTAQAYELRTGKLADGSVMGPQTAQAYELRTGKSALTGLQLPIYGPQTAQAYELRTGKRPDKISAKGRNLTDIENELKDNGSWANHYMLGAIYSMDLELFDLTLRYGGRAPPQLAFDRFYLSISKEHDGYGWANVDYVLVKKLINLYSQKELETYWTNRDNSEDFIIAAVSQGDKRAVQWLLNNNRYTDKEREIIAQFEWVTPEIKEILKPTTVMGKLSAMTGGLFF